MRVLIVDDKGEVYKGKADIVVLLWDYGFQVIPQRFGAVSEWLQKFELNKMLESKKE